LTSLEGDDYILCQITSQHVRDQYAIALKQEDFKTGGLKRLSHVRPNRLFTADEKIILYRVGQLKADKTKAIINKAIETLQA